MAVRVVGAGVGRTGTLSLKTGLEQLLGQPCYHMLEIFGRPDHVPLWREAAEGENVDWAVLLDGYGAVNGAAGALVLSGVIHPAGSVDRTALRWHVGVWDLWFLVWGTMLALATASYWRRTASRNGAWLGQEIGS